MIARLLQDDDRGYKKQSTERKVYQKGPAPSEEAGDRAADDRSARDCNTNAGAPEGIGSCPLLSYEGMIDDCKSRGQQKAGANALQGPGQIERQCRMRQPAEP